MTIATAILLGSFLVGDSADEALQHELRARGMTQLLEALSRERLDDRSLTQSERSNAAFDLANAISQRASRTLDSKKRRETWAEADGILKPYLQAAIGNDPATFQFRFKCALYVRERSETLTALMKVLPDDQELAADAREWAKKSAEQLSKLNTDVRRRHSQMAGGKSDVTMSLADLDSRTDVQAGLAQLAVVLAEPEGAVRLAAATEAEERLKPYTKDFFAHPLKMDAVLGMARLNRALNKPEDALQIVSVFDVHPEAPPEYRAQAELLISQLLLELNRTTEALQRLNVPENKRVPGGEWSLALFEALLRGSKPDIRGPELRRGEAMTLLDKLESEHGPYWKLRGEQVLAKYGDPSVMGDNPALLRYVADLRRKRKEYDAAVVLYDKAASLENSAGNKERAMRHGIAAAGTLSEKGDSDTAVKRFFEIAEVDRTSSLAADAYLGAAAALFPKHQKGDGKATVEYRRALDGALTIASASPVVRGETHWLRARLAEDEKQQNDALEHYRQIPADHPRFAAAVGAMAVLFHDSIVAKPAIATGDAVWNKALTDLETRLPKVTGTDGESARSRVLARWVLARLIGDRQPKRIAEATKLVREGVIGDPAGAFLAERAWPILLQWQVRLGKTSDALESIEKGYGEDAQRLVRDLLRELSPIEEGLTPEERKARAEIAQAVSDKWLSRSEHLTDKLRTQIKLLLGQAYSARDDHFNAHRLIRQLRVENPRDPIIAQTYAISLDRSGDYRDSLREWQALYVGFSKRGNEDQWLKIAVEYIRCLIQLNEFDRAKLELDKIEKNYKGKGTAETQAKLDELRKRV